MNCYFTCQKLSKFSKTCVTTTNETVLASFNLAHPVRQVSITLVQMNNVTTIGLRAVRRAEKNY